MNPTETEILINRLRTTRSTTKPFMVDAAAAVEPETRGERDGRRWATRSATAAELERLSSYWEKADDGGSSLADPQMAYGPGECLYFVVRPEDGGGRDEARGFWRAYSHNYEVDMLDMNYVVAFAEGAIAVWYEVEDKL